MKISKLFYKMRQTTSVMTAVALVLSLFTFWVGSVAYAGAINTHSVVLSTSKPAATGVTHTFHFKPSVTTSIKQVNLKYCTAAGAYGAACTAPADLTLPATGNVVLTGFGSNTGTFSAATNIESVVITTPASETTSTDHTIAISTIVNPSAGVFFVRVQTYSDTGTTVIDEGTVASATIAAITASGTQRETLTVSVAAEAGSVCGQAVSATTNTATAIGFGDFNGTTSISGNQLVSVGTNASNGYDLTMFENQALTNQSDGSKTITNFGTQGDAVAGTAWSAGVSTGFGICAESGHYNATAFGAGSTLYKDISVTATPLKIASYASPVASTGTKVNFRVAVPANQAAGVYSNEVVYIATPKY